jgi:hypothetical protein
MPATLDVGCCWIVRDAAITSASESSQNSARLQLDWINSSSSNYYRTPTSSSVGGALWQFNLYISLDSWLYVGGALWYSSTNIINWTANASIRSSQWMTPGIWMRTLNSVWNDVPTELIWFTFLGRLLNSHCFWVYYAKMHTRHQNSYYNQQVDHPWQHFL